MKITKRIGVALSAAAAIVATAASAASAAPAPGYEQFKGCPDQPNMYLCINSTITGGHLKLGNTDTPITSPITLNGGLAQGSNDFIFNSQGGLKSPRLRVPGGLTGLTGLTWLENLIPFDALKVYAIPQLAGTATDPSVVPFTLPLKIKLENPLLGDSCYIGSNAKPVLLNLTTGTTTPPPGVAPITGTQPSFDVDPAYPDGSVFTLDNGRFVDNNFAAPAATGCSFILKNRGLIDLVVDLRAGTPAAAGKNVADFNFGAKIADPGAVYPAGS
jgi:hypothetical protein